MRKAAVGSSLHPTDHIMSLRLRLKATYVDTPRGIFTDSGVWFRTREEWVRDYAGRVVDHQPLGCLLADAEVWLRSSQTLALWLVPALLFLVPPFQAFLAAVVVFVAWQCLGPALVSRTVLPLFRVLDAVLLQAAYYVWTMSTAAVQSKYVAVAVGLASFIVLRWELMRLVMQPLVRRIRGSLYRMPVPDHVLRSLIVRAALHHGIALKEFSDIEERIVHTLRRK